MTRSSSGLLSCEFASYRLISDLQSSLASAVGERRDTAVIQAAAAVEHHALDARIPRALRDQCPDRLRTCRLAFAGDLAVRRLRDRGRGAVVDQLRVDVLV